MCLGIPAKVIEIDNNKYGKVDYMDTQVKCNFALIEDIKVGDWVIIHAGVAISKLNEDEARETFDLLKEYINYRNN